MRKILHILSVGEYRRDMSKEEKFHRDNKIALLILVVLAMTAIAMSPLRADTIYNTRKFEVKDEWICPNKSCGYDNYDGIRYCGLCGTERGSRRR
ncbi:hypothetical protein UFOVP816_18 [uncultured Caudovirales phage]|uniref:RanBP2-type domain-containing protein n=1 Tax=uncultured Caudovirales phage TaxID=2100421 RepID=A0A6J5P2Z9_9CAUD|nr:hypothetical protein UFOVP816_18 [uncultured Caudovirales phage]